MSLKNASAFAIPLSSICIFTRCTCAVLTQKEYSIANIKHSLSFSKQALPNWTIICNDKRDLNPLQADGRFLCVHMLLSDNSGPEWPTQGGISPWQRGPQPTDVELASTRQTACLNKTGSREMATVQTWGAGQGAGWFNHLEAWPCHCSCWGNLSQSVCLGDPGPDVFPSWHLGLRTANDILPGEQQGLH